MADIAKSDGASETGASEAVKRLLAKLGIFRTSAEFQEKDIKEALSKAGKEKGMEWEEYAEFLSSQDPALRKVISATKRYESDLRYLQKLSPSISTPSIPGAGSLSNDKLWSVMGWKEHRPGEFVWSRPPNVSFRGRFPQTQATAYAASYEASPSGFALDPQDAMLPVTAAQAKEMREQDAMWARIEAAKQRGISRQMKIAMAAEDKRRQQEANVRAEMMDPHERFIYENTERFGKTGAEQVFRQRLLKELPPFFKDSKLSTKTLLAISKSLAGVKKTPFIGPMLGRMVQNPVAGASAAVYGAMVAAFGASDKANTTTIGWENAANLYGVPSKKFQDAAFLAGLKDPGEISRLYGKLTAQFGDPEMAISALGSAMGGMSSRERTFMAKDLGIDETTMALIDILSGNKHLNVGETRRTAANRAKLDVLQSLGYTSGSGVGSWLQSLFLSIPGMKGGAARDMELLPHVRQGYNDDLDILMFDAIERNIKGAADAADSLSSSESYGGGNTTNNSVSSANTALIINTMNVNGKDAMEIANGLKDIADSTLGSRANVLNAMDSRVAV